MLWVMRTPFCVATNSGVSLSGIFLAQKWCFLSPFLSETHSFLHRMNVSHVGGQSLEKNNNRPPVLTKGQLTQKIHPAPAFSIWLDPQGPQPKMWSTAYNVNLQPPWWPKPSLICPIGISHLIKWLTDFASNQKPIRYKEVFDSRKGHKKIINRPKFRIPPIFHFNLNFWPAKQ